MHSDGIAYIAFGLALVVTLGVIVLFYYSRKRKKRVEEPKYRMLDDED